MSESLWIMRHGEAAPGYPDPQRELTAHGRDEVAVMARWLGQSMDKSSLEGLRIAASPYQRAMQTAEIVAEHLGKRIEPLALITPDDPVEAVIDWLQDSAATSPWLLVSHMPLVGALTGRLVEGELRSRLPMPTAAIARLHAEVWAGGCASLESYMTPADLV